MRRVWIALVSIAGLFALFIALVFGLSEFGGEVVTLETKDAEGKPQQTRLWVVDHEGRAWLRSGAPESGWFLRLEADANVSVTRNGTTAAYRAEPVRDPAVRDRIHALMAEKYTFAERFIAATRDGTHSVPVRLIPSR